MTINSPISTYAKVLISLLTAGFILLIGVYRPIADWDVIGYVSAAYHLDGYRGRELSNVTYGDVRATEGLDAFQSYIAVAANPIEKYYRPTVYADPRSLTEQIPFYSIRPAYVGLIRVIGKWGISYDKASHVVSAAGGAVAVLALWRILSVAGVPWILAPFIAFGAGLAEVSRVAHPDSIAIAAAFLASLAVLEGSATAYAFVILLPFTRTDSVILSVLLMGLSYLMNRKIAALIAMALSIGSFVFINKITGNYGLFNVIHFTLLGRSPYPAEMIPSHDIRDYARIYVYGAYNFISNFPFLMYLIGAYLMHARNELVPRLNNMRPSAIFKTDYNKDGLFYVLYVIPILYAVAHMLLFPNYELRYFVFSATLVVVWIFSRETPRAVSAEKAPAFARPAYLGADPVAPAARRV